MSKHRKPSLFSRTALRVEKAKRSQRARNWQKRGGVPVSYLTSKMVVRLFLVAVITLLIMAVIVANNPGAVPAIRHFFNF